MYLPVSNKMNENFLINFTQPNYTNYMSLIMDLFAEVFEADFNVIEKFSFYGKFNFAIRAAPCLWSIDSIA